MSFSLIIFDMCALLLLYIDRVLEDHPIVYAPHPSPACARVHFTSRAGANSILGVREVKTPIMSMYVEEHWGIHDIEQHIPILSLPDERN